MLEWLQIELFLPHSLKDLRYYLHAILHELVKQFQIQEICFPLSNPQSYLHHPWMQYLQTQLQIKTEVQGLRYVVSQHLVVSLVFRFQVDHQIFVDKMVVEVEEEYLEVVHLPVLIM